MSHDSNAVSPWFVYIARCADDTLYTGITTNTARRMAEHNAGPPSGARYTQARRPVTLAYVESAASRAVATQRERAIKKLDRRGKLELCQLQEPPDRPDRDPSLSCGTLPTDVLQVPGVHTGDPAVSE